MNDTSTGSSVADRLAAPSDWKMGWAPQLDGLRAIATMSIMVFHFLSSFGDLVGGLVIGVDVFFALSGFLITTLLFAEMEKKQTISIRRFYIRRAVRLFPALYTLLAVFLVFALAAGGKDRNHYLGEIVAVFFYVYNYFVAWFGVEGNALIQLWTLSIEQQFYLLWPLLFLVVFRPREGQGVSQAKVKALIAAMIGFVVLWPVLRMTLPRELGERNLSSTVFGLSIMRPDAVALGCLAAVVMRLWARRDDPTRERRISVAGNIALALMLGSVALAPIDAFQPFVSPFANLAIMACAVFVFDLIRNPDKPVAKVLRSKPLVWIGERSYAMSMWHLLLFFIAKGFVEGALPGRTRLVELITLPIAFGLTFLVSMGSWRFIEQPAMKLKARFGA